MRLVNMMLPLIGSRQRRKIVISNDITQLVIITVIGCAFCQLGGVAGDRTFTKVYEPIEGTAACFKRLNGTDEIGCRSSSKGDVGILHVVEDQPSLQWVLKDGPHSPYIAILYPHLFTRENLLLFRTSGRVNGVLLLPKEKEPSTKVSKFSTDASCPNQQFGFYNTSSSRYCEKWNDPGNSLLYENFEFPIFFVKNQSEVDTLMKCYKTFNMPNGNMAQDWPLCAGQLKSFMMAAKDTPTCMRRSNAFSFNPGTAKVCDPLGDQNLWATLLPQNNDSNSSSNKKALILAARFDGASLFDEMSPSADSSVTGLVTLLTVIKHLGSIKDQLVISSAAPVDSIYFMLFNGEAFGYIGSSRIAYDMSQGNFPLNLTEIEYFIEVNQAALRSPTGSYFVHQTEQKQLNPDIIKILSVAASNQNLSIQTIPSNDAWGIPPSSLHSFLRERNDIPGLVITNHENVYQNPFYNSIYDTKDAIQYKYQDPNKNSLKNKIAALAATISNTVIELVEDSSARVSPIAADPETVDELLYCYLETSNCSTFRAISGFDPSPNSPMAPYPMYVGVSTYTNTLTQLTKFIIVNYLGTRVENATSQDACFGKTDDSDPSTKNRPRYYINGTCFDCPQVNMTEAKSPAFIIPDYDFSSGRYSTWTESVWQKFSVRIFLKPSLAHEILTLMSGILVLFISFGLMRFVNAKADLIFPSRYAGYAPVPPGLLANQIPMVDMIQRGGRTNSNYDFDCEPEYSGEDGGSMVNHFSGSSAILLPVKSTSTLHFHQQEPMPQPVHL